ncbi:MAG: hypothetical protein M3Z03_11325 [Actinomycetota bacterium]|nr:hypothetical protein [Actinomycetota bacterium]
MLVSGPVQVAAALLAVVIGLMIARPTLTGRPAGSRWVAVLLGIDTGVVLVAGVVLAAAAGRSWQLIGDAERPANPILDITGSDGDGNLYALLIIVIGLVTLLLTMLLASATRGVDGTQPGDRSLVASVLWVEAFLAVVCLLRLVLGDGNPFEVLVAAHLPLAAGGLVLQQRRHHRPA